MFYTDRSVVGQRAVDVRRCVSNRISLYIPFPHDASHVAAARRSDEETREEALTTARVLTPDVRRRDSVTSRHAFTRFVFTSCEI